MQVLGAGSLLREVARLHVQLQRESLSCCNGITPAQCGILSELGRSGPLTLAEIGRRLGLDKGWISRVVEALAREGVVDKAPGTADRRTLIVSLSPRGEALWKELNQSLDALEASIMNRLRPDERSEVHRSLLRLRQVLSAEAEGISPDAPDGDKGGNNR